MPGAAVAVIADDAVSFAAAGVTNVEDPQSVNEDTLFQIGSITKPFTATLIAMLIDERRLDIDTPIQTYIPELRLRDADVARRLTVRHLLGHTSGFEGDHFPPFEGPDALERLVATFDALPQHLPLGAEASYSNAGYSLLGRVIEVIEGAEFSAIVRERILAPLGMTRSCFAAEEAITWRVALGHVAVRGVPRLVRPWHVVRTAWPAGGLATTARELARFAQFQFGDGLAPDGRRLLAPGSLRRMRVPLAPSSIPVNGLGKTAFAWGVGTTPAGQTVIAHGGSTVSFRAQLTVAPEARAAFVVLTNSERGVLVLGALRSVVVEHLGLGTPSAPAFVHVDPAEYIGTYVSALQRVVVTASGDAVAFDAMRVRGLDDHQEPKPEPLGPTQARFVATDEAVLVEGLFTGMPVRFGRDASGGVAWVRYYGRAMPRVA